MGLADALFAGLGQGLQAGATNYVDGLQRQQQMDAQKQQMGLAAAEGARQAQTYSEQQAQQRLQGFQQGGIMAARAGDGQGLAAAANGIPDAFNAAYGTNLPAPSPLMGGTKQVATPLPGAPTGGLAQYGPTSESNPAPLGTQYTSQPDWNNPQTMAAATKRLMLPPNYTTLKYGEQQIMRDPITGATNVTAANEHQFNPVQRVSGGYLTTDEEGNTVFTPSGGHYRSGASGIYNTNDGTVTPGTAPAGRGVLKPYTDPTDGVTKYGYFTPDGKMIPTGAQAPSAAGRGSPATDAKQSQLLLQNVQDLSTKYGAPITSYGIRPVGSPGDTGKTIVNGHQTQYGLRYEYEHNGGPLAAIPGQSAHGNGMAVDIAVPRDTAGAKAAFTQRGLQVLDEGDHWHITAAGPLAPVAKPAKQSAAMSLLGGAAAGTPANDAGTQALQAAVASIQARQAAAAAAAKGTH